MNSNLLRHAECGALASLCRLTADDRLLRDNEAMSAAVEAVAEEADDEIAIAMRVLCINPNRSLKVPPHRWPIIFDDRRAGMSGRKLAEREGCSKSWIEYIVKAIAIARGVYAPNDWALELKRRKAESIALHHEWRKENDERTKVFKQAAANERAGISALHAMPSRDTSKEPRGYEGKGCW